MYSIIIQVGFPSAWPIKRLETYQKCLVMWSLYSGHTEAKENECTKLVLKQSWPRCVEFLGFHTCLDLSGLEIIFQIYNLSRIPGLLLGAPCTRNMYLQCHRHTFREMTELFSSRIIWNSVMKKVSNYGCKKKWVPSYFQISMTFL